MTLTIELPPETEQRLNEKAAREGEDTATLAADLVTQAVEWEALDSEDAVVGVRRGLEDFEAGRFRSFQEFAEEQRRRYGLARRPA
jgi:predicted transcriptional regulator